MKILYFLMMTPSQGSNGGGFLSLVPFIIIILIIILVIVWLPKKKKGNLLKYSNTEIKYPALLTISTTYLIFGWIIGFATVIVTVYFFSKPELGIFGLVSLVIGGLLVLGLVSFSEIIKVFIDIENNTRHTNETKETHLQNTPLS